MLNIMLNRLAVRLQPGVASSAGKRLVVRAAATLALVVSFLASAGVAQAAKPDIDPSYADGKTVYMIGPHMITNPNPQMFAQSQELYLLAYPSNGGTVVPVFASGYTPQCDPCFHPGLPLPFVFHDHVLSGAPGLGNNGTAGEFKGPWKIIVLMYNPSVLADPNFKPVTSEVDLDAAEATGEFLPINAGGTNPYEVVTGSVLICPLVSPEA